MSKINNEIKEVIEKNLPAQVGETLQKRLKECDQFEEDLAKSKGFIENLEARVKEYSTKNTELNQELMSFKNREDQIKQKEIEIKEKEIDLDKKTA